jgi:RimJ/RimL family protein N-acetyltransferase
MLSHISAVRGVKTFTARTALESKPSCTLLEGIGFTLEKAVFSQNIWV